MEEEERERGIERERKNMLICEMNKGGRDEGREAEEKRTNS